MEAQRAIALSQPLTTPAADAAASKRRGETK
jgi:hypothetical protein